MQKERGARDVNLRNKVVVVTGSGGEGSGRAEARRLAAEGCRVVVSDVNEAGGNETVRLIEAAGGTAKFCRCDVNVKNEVKALIAYAEKQFGGVDILINNASGAPYHPDAAIEQWYETIQGDLISAFYGLEFGVAATRKRGGGAIINVSSTSAVGHGKDHSPAPAYDTAKAAVLRLTTTLAGLAKTDNIRVNCLVPAWIATPEVKAFWDALTPEQRRNPRIPASLLSLDEVAQAVVDLITDDSLAGRVLLLRNGEKPALISEGDAGYARLEPFPR